MLFVNSELFYIHVCEKVDVHISLLNFHPFNNLHWCKKNHPQKWNVCVIINFTQYKNKRLKNFLHKIPVWLETKLFS